jgi:Flp pilus assembly pilin Flp
MKNRRHKAKSLVCKFVSYRLAAGSAGRYFIQKEIRMFKLLKRFIREEKGQDFAEYALILGAVGVVAIAVIAQYKTELIAAFQAGIDALRMARGG